MYRLTPVTARQPSWERTSNQPHTGNFHTMMKGGKFIYSQLFPQLKRKKKKKKADSQSEGGGWDFEWLHDLTNNSPVQVEISHHGNATIPIPNQNGA